MSNQLVEVKESNKALLKTQQESLDLQQDLVENGITLSQVLQESRTSVAKLMNELRYVWFIYTSIVLKLLKLTKKRLLKTKLKFNCTSLLQFVF